MNPLSIEDVKNLHEYELERPDFRARVIALKKRRRVPLGPLMTVVFENRDTVRFQVQEMVRIERIATPDKVQAELDVYNDLLPRPGEVAATLFIEVTDSALIQSTLDGFVGLDEPGKVVLRVGPKEHPAAFAEGQSREDRISAVHYLRFALGQEAREALERGEHAQLEVRHGDYQSVAPLSQETVGELLRDLEG